jgi:hypothetical protein
MSDDDYMSEDFLASLQDVKPSIAANRSQQRMLRIHSNRDAAEQQTRKVPRKEQLEKEKLEEGLNKPVDNQSKGFALLAKMGYKPGMSLGKQKEGSEGIKEPLSISLKTGRMGLGGETAEKEAQQERCEMHLKRMKMQADMHETLATDFRKRKRGVKEQRQIIGDIIRTRKACHELDVRLSVNEPAQFWFWPIYRNKDAEEDAASAAPIKRLRNDRDEETEDEAKYQYSCGKEAPPEMRFDELDEDELNDCLELITRYVRAVHFYCIWCGCAYSSVDDLSAHCPGKTRADHE